MRTIFLLFILAADTWSATVTVCRLRRHNLHQEYRAPDRAPRWLRLTRQELLVGNTYHGYDRPLCVASFSGYADHPFPLGKSSHYPYQ
jgi:hypothetical protein